MAMQVYIQVYIGSLSFLGINEVLKSKEQMDLVKWMKDTVPEKPLDLRSQTGPCVQKGLTLRVTREGGQK